MLRTYLKINEKSIKWLWVLIILGVLAAIPITFERIQTERTARQVEFVFDYRDLLDIAEYKANPGQYIAEQLAQMKASGISSMSVYESTLDELQLSRHLSIYSSREVMMMGQASSSAHVALPLQENVTYILFSDKETAAVLSPLVSNGLALQGIATRPWSWQGQEGMVIELVPEDAMMKPLDPDPLTMKMLQEAGFQLVVRLSNRIQPFSVEHMDDLLSRLQALGVKRIIFDGPDVPGYSYGDTQEDLLVMGELLHKYGMGLATIELLRQQQSGFATLAREVKYNVVRLHSFSEQDGERLARIMTDDERQQVVQTVSDRFVLAVKDRNIRMIFLNAKPIKNVDKGIYTDALEPLYDSLRGKDGATNRVIKEGFTLGPAKQVALVHSAWQKFAKAVLLLACVALIAVTIAVFIPSLRLASFVIGVIGSAGLYVLSSSLYGQATALAVGICTSSLAVIMAIRWVDARRDRKSGSSVAFALGLFIRSVLISMIGVLFIVGLLNNITYFLVLEQFRGVSALHLLPMLIIAIYLLFFREQVGWEQRWQQLRIWLSMHIRISWVVIGGIALLVGMYYLSRTGNAGQTSMLERMFRSFLENTLGVRPRNKEFLFAHPLFLFGGYLTLKYRHAAYLFIAGVVGQLSIVDTFAHLHTPVVISLIRTGYGIVFGLLVGLVLIVAWEIIAKGWHRWAPRANR